MSAQHLHIESLDLEAQGVAHRDGKVVFVDIIEDLVSESVGGVAEVYGDIVNC